MSIKEIMHWLIRHRTQNLVGPLVIGLAWLGAEQGGTISFICTIFAACVGWYACLNWQKYKKPTKRIEGDPIDY